MTNHQQHSNIEAFHTTKSNEQRLKSLEEYDREKKNKKRLIKDSLNNENKTTHLKFDSDDDDKSNNNEDRKPKQFKNEKIQLFDDNEELNIDEHFNNDKQKKKKQKLQHIQTRLTTTNDPRFQISEKFLDDHEKIDDDDDDDDDGDNEKTIESNTEMSFEEEKKKSLAILDQITKLKSKPHVEKSKTKMIRFDPSKTEHKIYEIGSEIPIDEHKRENSERIQPKSILKSSSEPKQFVDTKRTYEFDESKLKSLFNKTSVASDSSNFQFQFFNNNQSIDASIPKPTPLAKPISYGKVKTFVNNKVEDTSSEEDDENEEASALTENTKIEEEIKNNTFFFFDIDNRLKDGLDNFICTEDLDDLERAWPTKRKEIAEALRTKHRKAVQHKDKRRVFNHRRRQKEYTPVKPSFQSNDD